MDNKDRKFVICSAVGHLYTVGDPSNRRSVYPILDTEWFPSYMVNKESFRTQNCIEVIQDLAKDASDYINCCDFDIEGSVIGYNILRYACGVTKNIPRAKFSTLTRAEVRQAVRSARPGADGRLAEAGRARHVMDFIYGINLSRALSEAYLSTKSGFTSFSVGRVQGPTLAMVVDREIDIQTFVPTPFWTISADIDKDGTVLQAAYIKEKVETLVESEKIRKSCQGKDGVISRVSKTKSGLEPPFPFNLGDLQREAHKVFGFSPSQTLVMAERLYLSALISYPRTSSQKLPVSIDCKKILHDLRASSQYSADVDSLLKGKLSPNQGPKSDPAHPSIYPTGELPKRQLEYREGKLFDLIVRRFFAVFGEKAIRESIIAVVTIAKYDFKLNGRRLLYSGWIRYYRPYISLEDVVLPSMDEGEKIKVLSVKSLEKFEQPPHRYNQSSLLDKMEREDLGTKATRADIIRTLYTRGYLLGERITATDIAFTVIEVMRSYAPEIISVEMTRDLEGQLEEVESGRLEEIDVLRPAILRLCRSLKSIKKVESSIGENLRKSIFKARATENLLGDCPECKTGKLTMIKSRTTGKRFVGCTNYLKSCRASAPLPQKGTIQKTSRPCPTCQWPVVLVRTGRRYPWRLCVNISCPSKKQKFTVRKEVTTS